MPLVSRNNISITFSDEGAVQNFFDEGNPQHFQKLD
jgi:hypothetical protein